MKLRLKITKGEPVRYISHLDFARTMEKVLRRAKIPAAYSEGFNPHMKVSFASALAVGITSGAEYLDIELVKDQEYQLDNLLTQLSRELPAGIEQVDAVFVEDKAAALMAVVNLASYIVACRLIGDSEPAAHAVREFMQADKLEYVRVNPKGSKTIDIKPYIEKLSSFAQEGELMLQFWVRITPQGSAKPQEVIEVLVDQFGLPVDKESILIHRTGLFVEHDGMIKTPLD